MKKKIRKRGRNKVDKDGYEYNFDGLNMKDFKTVPRPSWLPTPGELSKRLKNAKVTIILDESTVNFFKREAEKHGTKYQKMIREILKHYRIRFEEDNAA